MKKRKMMIAVLLLMLLASIGITYAYWASAVNGAQNNANGNVTIGKGKEVTTEVTVGNQTGTNLVPADRVDDSPAGSVGYVDLTFSITWKEADQGDAASGFIGALEVNISNLTIDGDSTLGSKYANVVIQPTSAEQISLNGTAVTVIIRVTLDEPENYTDYQAVAEKAIQFNVTFKVTTN